MKYISNGKIKKRIKELGFRSNNGFLFQLDLVIDIILVRCAEYTRPQKTMDREAMLAYMQKHNIK